MLQRKRETRRFKNNFGLSPVQDNTLEVESRRVHDSCHSKNSFPVPESGPTRDSTQTAPTSATSQVFYTSTGTPSSLTATNLSHSLSTLDYTTATMTSQSSSSPVSLSSSSSSLSSLSLSDSESESELIPALSQPSERRRLKFTPAKNTQQKQDYQFRYNNTRGTALTTPRYGENISTVTNNSSNRHNNRCNYYNQYNRYNNSNKKKRDTNCKCIRINEETR